MEFKPAPDVKTRLLAIQKKLQIPHINIHRIVCFRSTGSRSRRAQARIWAFPRIWQMALNQPPHYCLEVLSEKFDSLKEDDKIKILIHELMHIPKTFSGALLPHRGRGRVVINHQSVNQLFKKYKA